MFFCIRILQIYNVRRCTLSNFKETRKEGHEKRKKFVPPNFGGWIRSAKRSASLKGVTVGVTHLVLGSVDILNSSMG